MTQPNTKPVEQWDYIAMVIRDGGVIDILDVFGNVMETQKEKTLGWQGKAEVTEKAIVTKLNELGASGWRLAGTDGKTFWLCQKVPS